MVKISHVPRYRDLAVLLVRHREAVGAGSLDGAVDDSDEELRADGERLASDLEEMGPTFVKFGQLLSTRADLLPPAYLGALRRLQDHATPIPFDEVREVVEAELGTRLHRAFAWFDERSAAAASLGQVHHAALRDGREVAVKVQRPNIRAQILDDMDVLVELATLVDTHTAVGRRFGFELMVEEFRRSLLAELDFRAEARHLEEVGANLARHDRIVVPKPVDSYTTAVLLTMEWVSARSLGSLGPIARVEIAGHELADELFAAYLDQILIDGVFHADPHPGNLALTDDGRLALLDLGMVGRIAPPARDALLKLLVSLSQGRGDVVADVLADLGEHQEDFHADEFRRRVSTVVEQNAGRSVRELQAGSLLVEVLQAANVSGVRPPSELTMVGKAMLNLDESARILDPDFDPGAAVERHVEALVRRKMLEDASPASLLSSALDMKAFAEHFPNRVNKVLDALAEGRFTLNIQGLDERQLMRGVQKLANRVAVGVTVAALIIAGAIALSSSSRPRVLGEPVASFVLFGLAFVIALWMVVGIVLSDLPQYRAGGRARRRALMRRRRP